jgi:hypothetical protein
MTTYQLVAKSISPAVSAIRTALKELHAHYQKKVGWYAEHPGEYEDVAQVCRDRLAGVLAIMRMFNMTFPLGWEKKESEDQEPDAIPMWRITGIAAFTKGERYTFSLDVRAHTHAAAIVAARQEHPDAKFENCKVRQV